MAISRCARTLPSMAGTLILMIFAFMAAPILAIPLFFSNITDLTRSHNQPVFHSEPGGRGTVGLIVSCSATLIICIWTSVHADIPPPHSTRLIRFSYKVVWTVGSAVVPEALIVCALGQWFEARDIQKVWRKKYGEHGRALSMEEAFFVVMGGFTVCEVTEEKTEEETKTTTEKEQDHYTSTLTSDGFRYCVNSGLIGPDSFQQRNISDKGKGNSITKLIALFQVLWLVMQCIARRVDHLPLTLLEIHVVIQVACTIVTYGLWWSKPLDVEQPILLQSLYEEIPVRGTTKTPASDATDAPALDRAKKFYKSHTDKLADDRSNRYNFITRKGPPKPLPTAALAYYDVGRYIGGDGKMMIMEAFLTIPVGGLHLVAWYVHFPTLLECWIWRVSSVLMCTLPFGITSLAYAWEFNETLVSWMLKRSFATPRGFKANLRYLLGGIVAPAWKWGGKEHRIRHILAMGFCLTFFGLYTMAAVYVLVESYISLRDPPDKAFLTPLWSNFVPHL